MGCMCRIWAMKRCSRCTMWSSTSLKVVAGGAGVAGFGAVVCTDGSVFPVALGAVNESDGAGEPESWQNAGKMQARTNMNNAEPERTIRIVKKPSRPVTLAEK